MELIIFFASILYVFGVFFCYNTYKTIGQTWSTYRRGLTRLVMGFLYVFFFLWTWWSVFAPIHLYLSTNLQNATTLFH